MGIQGSTGTILSSYTPGSGEALVCSLLLLHSAVIWGCPVWDLRCHWESQGKVTTWSQKAGVHDSLSVDSYLPLSFPPLSSCSFCFYIPSPFLVLVLLLPSRCLILKNLWERIWFLVGLPLMEYLPGRFLILLTLLTRACLQSQSSWLCTTGGKIWWGWVSPHRPFRS